jgi:Flp pilus assembly pilin Flp
VETTKDRVQEFTVNGDQVVATVKELVREGNVRRLIIKNEQGATLIEIPLTFGVIGAALLPVFAAIGALAALATRCTIVVEREEPSSDGTDAAAPIG